MNRYQVVLIATVLALILTSWFTAPEYPDADGEDSTWNITVDPAGASGFRADMAPRYVTGTPRLESRSYGDSAPTAALRGPAKIVSATGGESKPGWASSIDLSRPECRKMYKEMLSELAQGSSATLYYIGDCDVRLKEIRGLP